MNNSTFGTNHKITAGTTSEEDVILIEGDDECANDMGTCSLTPPVSKKPKIDSNSPEDDCVVVEPSNTQTTPPVPSKRRPPLFYLTKVRGIRDVFNGGHLAIGIKGRMNIIIHDFLY